MGFLDLKKTYIVDVATSLFLSEGIDNVTIKEIAEAADVGEMTIYRYFGKKQNIVAEAVLSLQEIVSNDYFALKEAKTGYEKLKVFYSSYLEVFKNKPEYFRFIREFDLLMMSEDENVLKQYEKGIEGFKNAFIDAYNLGIKDKTIKTIDNIELFYFTTTHALIELCKKLSYKKGVLAQDKRIKKTDEIQCLINTILVSLKA